MWEGGWREVVDFLLILFRFYAKPSSSPLISQRVSLRILLGLVLWLFSFRLDLLGGSCPVSFDPNSFACEFCNV